MNNKSVFNISIIEIMLILLFIFISISIYQLNYKSYQITELTQIVESEREILKEITNNDMPKLENRIEDLVNLEQCKKSNIALKNSNTPLDYITNKISYDIKNADTRKYAKEYDKLKNEKVQINNQISNLKNNELTINILTQLHQQDSPLHQQIMTLEEKIKDNYKNRMILVNNIKELKTDDKVKYILSRLDKNNAPVHEQIAAIDKELNQLNQNRLGKNYNKITTHVLNNLNQNNKPINQQIDALKHSLENKNLLREIENLKKQLANNLNKRNENLNIKNMKKALNNLEDIKKNPSIPHDQNSKNVLEKIGMNNMPLNDQINQINNTLNLDKQLKKQISNNLKPNNKVLNTKNIAKALNNLNDIKNNHTNTYTPNSKDVLRELDMNDKPLHEQIDKLKNKLNLDKQLKEKLANNLKNNNLDTNNLKKALDNLQNIKNNNAKSYEPNSKDILKNLGIQNKPLNEQINDLKNKLSNNLKNKNNNLDTNNLKKALDNLQNIKNNNAKSYEPNSKDILKNLGIQNKPLNEQINDLKNKLDEDNQLKKQIKELEEKIDKNLLLKDPKINKENIQKVLNDLTKLKNNNNDKIYKDELRDALNSIKEIQKIKNKLSNKTNAKPILNKDIENAIKYFEDKARNPNLKADKDIQTTLDKFNIKGGKPTNKQLSNLYKNLYSTPSDNTNVSELNFALKRLKNQKDLDDRLKYINNFLDNTTNTNEITNDKSTEDCTDKYSKNEIETLKNKIKYLQKKIEKGGITHLPCILDNDGSSIFLFTLYLRDNNIRVELGKHESVKESSKNLPNLDKLVNKTMSLKKFMKLTKPIFEESIQDECRQFVYFKDETISKKEYKRKTLSIQHHFYKYIDHRW